MCAICCSLLTACRPTSGFSFHLPRPLSSPWSLLVCTCLLRVVYRSATLRRIIYHLAMCKLHTHAFCHLGTHLHSTFRLSRCRFLFHAYCCLSILHHTSCHLATRKCLFRLSYFRTTPHCTRSCRSRRRSPFRASCLPCSRPRICFHLTSSQPPVHPAGRSSSNLRT